MTISAITTFGTWLASKTPIIVEWAPYSYFICIGLALLISGGIILIIRELAFTGTKKRTFIEIHINNGKITATNNRANVFEELLVYNPYVVALPGGALQQQGYIYNIFVIFEKRIHKPAFYMEDRGFNVNCTQSSTNHIYSTFAIIPGTQNGKFIIDFNHVDNIKTSS